MADIFVSYTSSDRDWAFWIGQELEALGHMPHVHDWEIPGGGNIAAWMTERLDRADHVLFVVSQAYFAARYSRWEREAAEWAAAKDQSNFALPVLVEECEIPRLLALRKRCDLHGVQEEEARARLKTFLAPAVKPAGPMPFPGAGKSGSGPRRHAPAAFPGKRPPATLSNVPIAIPRHFLGRDGALAAIEAALERDAGRVAVTALHGLRGVGKTTLAAAYAERHSDDYRATWWIRAQNEAGMRADLVALGVRLGWVAADAKEEPALAAAMERLRQEGEGILLIYDNAIEAAALKPFLPPSGGARVLITSNAPAWRGVAEPVEVDVWPVAVGADYLIARTGRAAERAAAVALSEALGGLPLAHEQAAAYCERLDISLAEYGRRFAAAPAKFLDDARHAPSEYHDGLTVAKTFSLAIEEAAKRHPAAEPLIVHAALLAPEPIPLFLFAEGREELGEPLAAALADDGLDETVAALRTFALLDREAIADEREPTIATDCIRLHRLVREVAAVRCEDSEREGARRSLVEALARVYPREVWNDHTTWPRARRLDPHALAVVGSASMPLNESAAAASFLLDGTAAYRHRAVAVYNEARSLYERALEIAERALGPEHPSTTAALNNLALLLQAQGDLAGARPLCERALAIREKVLGPEHPDTATTLSNLALLLHEMTDFAVAQRLCERALAIREKVLGPEHPDTAVSLVNLAGLLRHQGDLLGARRHYERALAIDEKVYGCDHPQVALDLNQIAVLLQNQGDAHGARTAFERALTIEKKAIGPEHPNTNLRRSNLARLLIGTGEPAEALRLGEAALAAHELTLGPSHAWTKNSARVTADALAALGRSDEAAALRTRYGLKQATPTS